MNKLIEKFNKLIVKNKVINQKINSFEKNSINDRKTNEEIRKIKFLSKQKKDKIKRLAESAAVSMSSGVAVLTGSRALLDDPYSEERLKSEKRLKRAINELEKHNDDTIEQLRKIKKESKKTNDSIPTNDSQKEKFLFELIGELKLINAKAKNLEKKAKKRKVKPSPKTKSFFNKNLKITKKLEKKIKNVALGTGTAGTGAAAGSYYMSGGVSEETKQKEKDLNKLINELKRQNRLANKQLQEANAHLYQMANKVNDSKVSNLIGKIKKEIKRSLNLRTKIKKQKKKVSPKVMKKNYSILNKTKLFLQSLIIGGGAGYYAGTEQQREDNKDNELKIKNTLQSIKQSNNQIENYLD